jgi:hypothetical protein
MGIVNLRKSEQDFYDSTVKQASAVLARAQSEANGLINDTIKSICESHDSEFPLSCEPVNNKNGKVIALLWGAEQKDWREGNLHIDGAVYPPGLPLKPKQPANGTNGAAKGAEGAGAPPAGTTAPAKVTETVAPPAP